MKFHSPRVLKIKPFLYSKVSHLCKAVFFAFLVNCIYIHKHESDKTCSYSISQSGPAGERIQSRFSDQLKGDKKFFFRFSFAPRRRRRRPRRIKLSNFSKENVKKENWNWMFAWIERIWAGSIDENFFLAHRRGRSDWLWQLFCPN